MAEMIKKAAAWLGLVSDDRYVYDAEDDTEYSQPIWDETEPVETPPAPISKLSSRKSNSAVIEEPEAFVDEVVTKAAASKTPEQRTADLARIITVKPRTYNEARTIGEHFRDGVPVIMNLSDMDDVDAKRLVDFAAGLIFGLRGTIERVTSKVFLLSPQNVNVTAEDKERIAGGFYNQS